MNEDKWSNFLTEGRKDAGDKLDRALGWFLDSGPQKKGGYKNKRAKFKGKKFNDISAPPGAPGGLEEEVEPETFEKHDELDPRFWNPQKLLKDSIVKRLIKIVEDFIEGLDVEQPIAVEDIRLTGSLANYNWSKYSDVDLHIVVDFSSIDEDEALVKAFFDNARMRWNDRHDIKIYGHEVEIYVENINEDHRSSGIYSIMEDEWIVEPDPQKVEIDFSTARKKSDDITTQVNMIEQFYQSKPRSALKSIERLKERIRTMRRAGLDSPAQEYSAENIAFKILRREEVLDRLDDMKYNAYDMIMSMGEEHAAL